MATGATAKAMRRGATAGAGAGVRAQSPPAAKRMSLREEIILSRVQVGAGRGVRTRANTVAVRRLLAAGRPLTATARVRRRWLARPPRQRTPVRANAAVAVWRTSSTLWRLPRPIEIRVRE